MAPSPSSFKFLRALAKNCHKETGKCNGLLRVVDESGEDYFYSRSQFAALKVPQGLEQALAAAG